MSGIYLKVEFNRDETLEKIKEVEDATANLRNKVNELYSWLNVKASSPEKDERIKRCYQGSSVH